MLEPMAILILYIIADKLSPLQIRIAHLIARAPDNSENITDNKKSSTPEKSYYL